MKLHAVCGGRDKKRTSDDAQCAHTNNICVATDECHNWGDTDGATPLSNYFILRCASEIGVPTSVNPLRGAPAGHFDGSVVLDRRLTMSTPPWARRVCDRHQKSKPNSRNAPITSCAGDAVHFANTPNPKLTVDHQTKPIYLLMTTRTEILPPTIISKRLLRDIVSIASGENNGGIISNGNDSERTNFTGRSSCMCKTRRPVIVRFEHGKNGTEYINTQVRQKQRCCNLNLLFVVETHVVRLHDLQQIDMCTSSEVRLMCCSCTPTKHCLRAKGFLFLSQRSHTYLTL